MKKNPRKRESQKKQRNKKQTTKTPNESKTSINFRKSS